MNNLKEFERMLTSPKSKLLERKAELITETATLSRILDAIDDKILIWSAIDMLVVKDLEVTKREVESLFLDVLNESNDLWLQSIKSA